MSYRDEPLSAWACVQMFAIGAICLAIVVGVIGYFNVESRKLQVEQTRIEQEQETIRNEEDNQWWQKAIPWGEYEDEEER